MSSLNNEQIGNIVGQVVAQLQLEAPHLFNETLPKAESLDVALGGDHGGYDLKEALVHFLEKNGFSVFNAGTMSKDSVDYPDFAANVGRAVASGHCKKGIIIDSAGIGSCMAANKIKGVRAALCYNRETILNSRLHNDANVLTLGSRFHSTDEASVLSLLWLSTQFEGGRHQKRIDKITMLEQN